MAVNITVDPRVSPRIITIDPGQDSTTVQELVDAIRDYEDSEDGHTFDYLLEAAGKEALGGGVAVSITAELQNAEIMFASRKVSKEEGTVTTADTTGYLLTDTAATFETNGVVAGAEVINFTDKSVATVLEVLGETQLRTCGLTDGTDNQWNFGDEYKVWNQDVCTISGGNIVAVDEVGASSEPVLPSFGTYVKTAASTSASLVDPQTWDQLLADHRIVDSFGDIIRKIKYNIR